MNIDADLTIRLASPDDAAAIAAMSRDSIERGLSWSWRDERVAAAIKDAETNVAVAGRPGAVLAFGIMSYPDDDAHLLLFAVRRSQRRLGVGSALLLWLEAVARAMGAERIRVEARRDNMVARSFYNEHGFHERALRQSMYGDGVDGVRLEKWLRASA